MTQAVDCPLCTHDGGLVLLCHPLFRVVRVQGPDAAHAPGFYRVIWQAHVAEFSDLPDHEQTVCMRAVSAVERVVREHLQPTKVNVASLGNMVPHLHWHVVARFVNDPHFPSPIWAAPARAMDTDLQAHLHHALPLADAAIARIVL
jgi:diadenosine tetraphosphate (Ap4A) HIT family hydrolase